jgi:hypothetical protein
LAAAASSSSSSFFFCLEQNFAQRRNQKSKNSQDPGHIMAPFSGHNSRNQAHLAAYQPSATTI